jgi:hypothetical protein
MLAYRNLPCTKRIGQPARNHRYDPLMVADVRLVYAWHGGMAYLMRHNSQKVARDGVRVEVDHALFKIRHALAQFLRRGPLHLDRPPFSIKLEA